MSAIYHADFKCEIDASHYTFLRRSGKPYTEPHHLIPMSQQAQFSQSLDNVANIVSLCSNCHKEIHYGRDANKLIHKLYGMRKDLLIKAGFDITEEELLLFYR